MSRRKLAIIIVIMAVIAIIIAIVKNIENTSEAISVSIEGKGGEDMSTAEIVDLYNGRTSDAEISLLQILESYIDNYPDFFTSLIDKWPDVLIVSANGDTCTLADKKDCTVIFTNDTDLANKINSYSLFVNSSEEIIILPISDIVWDATGLMYNYAEFDRATINFQLNLPDYDSILYILKDGKTSFALPNPDIAAIFDSTEKIKNNPITIFQLLEK